MTEHLRKTVSMLAEKRMRQSALDTEVKQRFDDEHSAEQLIRQIHPYVAISRDTGAGAGELGELLGRRLGWDVFNKELLEFMVDKYHLDKSMVEMVDETSSSWMLETFGKWISQRVVTQTEYISRLGKVLMVAARHGNTIFVGRGAQFFLPRERGVAIQVIAPLTMRLERVMQREGITADEARRYLKKKDSERRDFVREHFGYDVTDPHLYDLVVNLEHLSMDHTVELIASVVQQRFG